MPAKQYWEDQNQELNKQFESSLTSFEDAFSSAVKRFGPLPEKSTISFDSIKNLFDKEKQHKLSLLIDFFEENGNQSLANRYKFNGIPVAIYAPPGLLKSTRECFNWMEIDVVEHHLFPPGEIVFSWADNPFKPKP